MGKRGEEQFRPGVFKPRNRLRCQLEVLLVRLQPDTLQTTRCGRRNRRTGPHERIQDDAFFERQYTTNDLSEELLWFERGMRSNGPLAGRCYRGWDDIPEGFLHGNPPKASGFPL